MIKVGKAGELKAFSDYLEAVQRTLAAGHASEGSHYPSLKILLESLNKDLTATSLPSRIECGAPDFVITKNSTTIGYVEAKDVGKNLDDIEQRKGPDGERFGRYLASLTNLILTDYLEFRWYLGGELCLSARLGTLTKEGRIKRDKAGAQAVAELLANFLSHKAGAVGTSKELALCMARLAHMIRSLIIAAFARESESGSLHNQLSAFRDNLIPGLSAEQFADMYAQTIAYGLFAARCTNSTSKDFTRQDAAYLLPKTNPFLRKLFNHIAGPELDDRVAWLVDDLAQLLAQADMASILHDFGKSTAKEDPVVHFYETFLTAYDPEVREMRGVYYTPEPVVSYIVRSINHLLKTRFNRPQGLADTNTLILDPAVGTATFLYAVVNETREALIGQEGMWNDYVAKRLLPRLFGFELLMAPYAVAHLKLGLLLQETGYQFKGDQRLGIYLTNTLEEAFKKSEQLAGFNEYIVDEANAAAEIKKEKKIMVVLGNPPYSGISANRGKWITELIDGVFDKDGHEIVRGYKRVDGQPLQERKLWLQDDYVKFIRFGQWRIELTGQGILGFITNHAYLDNPTFRGMRQSLMDTFTDIYVLDLHGSAKKRETAPGGGKDENVFDIQQGVAISLFVKEAGKTGPAKVYQADLWGLREGKYQTLSETDITTTGWAELKPNSPFYFFVPRYEELRPEYEKGWKITDIYPVKCTGIVTARDNFVIDFESSAIRQRILTFLDQSLDDVTVKERLSLSENYAWRVSQARKELIGVKELDSYFTEILYRPFDVRSIYYHPSVVWRTRQEIMHNMLAGHNVALCVGRAGQVIGPETWDIVFPSRLIDDFNLFYRGGNVNFPLYLYPSKQPDEAKPEPKTIQEAARLRVPLPEERPHRQANLDIEFIKVFSDKLGLKFVEDGKGDLKGTFGPEDVFNYAYAVFHSPSYRSRYAEFLKIDFPRLPLTSDRKLFRTLAEKGAELVSLHLMESSMLNSLITKYPVPDSNLVEKVTYSEPECRVYINSIQYFEGISPEVWNFHIGGYQVCQKWLKDRKGRTLNYDELTHYQKIVIALKETLRLMVEIDNLILGWPLR